MDPVTPRRGQRNKTMSMKAAEAIEVQQVIDLDGSSDEELFPTGSSESSFSEEDDDDDEDNVSENEADESETEDCPKPKYLTQSKSNANTSKSKPIKKKSGRSYIIKSEDYFYNSAIKKPQTSSHTLDHLNKPRLSQEELRKILSNLSISKQHRSLMRNICLEHKTFFKKWLCLLHEGFNILTYGLGSKREILTQFQEEYLTDLPVIVVNGFFPSLTMKEILDSIIVHILEISESPANNFDAAELISEEFQRYPNLHLYIIIHNIDGDILRNSKSQGVLAKLTDIPNVHMIASIDHVNAPLIWDQNKLSKFNFTWWDLANFLPYKDETSFETSMMVNKSGSLALSSLRNVFLSLTSNSKGIYLTMVKYQLQQASQYYLGMLFKDLYQACREAFLVSSDLALRTQLTEFVDHKMVKFRRSADGAEHLIIPIQNNLLQQFLNDNEKK